MAAGNKLWRNNDISNIPYNNSHAKSDFGWDLFSDSLPNPNLDITVIETSKNPANVVYLGTKFKKLYRIDNANVGDPAIVELTSPFTSSNAYVYDIAINPNDADEIMVIYSNYSVYSVFHSIDGGQNWTKVAGNLEQNPSGSGNGPSCRTAEIIPLGNSTLYLIGTSVGLFGTANLDEQNTVWEQVASQEIGAVVCEYLAYRQTDGLLVVATHGNGIYQTNLTSIGDVLDIEDFNTNLIELNIFPNPVRDKLNISFTLNRTSDVKIVVFDELGRVVKKEKVFHGYSGINNISLNIASLKSGIYFVSWNINDEIVTNQIIKE